jgi:hypothetical protein
MKTISQDVIRLLQFTDPEIGEHRRILAALASMIHEIEALGGEPAKLVALKSDLASDVLTGRVRVPEGIAVTG